MAKRKRASVADTVDHLERMAERVEQGMDVVLRATTPLLARNDAAIKSLQESIKKLLAENRLLRKELGFRES